MTSSERKLLIKILEISYLGLDNMDEVLIMDVIDWTSQELRMLSFEPKLWWRFWAWAIWKQSTQQTSPNRFFTSRLRRRWTTAIRDQLLLLAKSISFPFKWARPRAKPKPNCGKVFRDSRDPLPGWPVKSRQMSKKSCSKMISIENERFWHL